MKECEPKLMACVVACLPVFADDLEQEKDRNIQLKADMDECLVELEGM